MKFFKIFTKIPVPLYAIIGLIIFFTSVEPSFFAPSSIMNMLLQGSALFIVAAGMTLAILTAGIDLSLAALPGLSSVLFAITLNSGMPEILVLLIPIVACLLCGLFSGFIIGFFEIDEFIATLGMMGIAQSLALVISNGAAISLKSSFLVKCLGGQVSWLGIPVPIYLAALIFAIFYVLLGKTKFGTYIYAIGGNREATALSGINVPRTRFILYGITAVMGAIGGLVLSGRMNTGHPNAGVGMEFEAIASTVIGGTALSGGEGGVVGTVMGVAIVTILRSGLGVVGLPASWQMVVLGLLIVGTIVVDTVRRNLRVRRHYKNALI